MEVASWTKQGLVEVCLQRALRRMVQLRLLHRVRARRRLRVPLSEDAMHTALLASSYSVLSMPPLDPVKASTVRGMEQEQELAERLASLRQEQEAAKARLEAAEMELAEAEETLYAQEYVLGIGLNERLLRTVTLLLLIVRLDDKAIALDRREERKLSVSASEKLTGRAPLLSNPLFEHDSIREVSATPPPTSSNIDVGAGGKNSAPKEEKDDGEEEESRTWAGWGLGILLRLRGPGRHDSVIVKTGDGGINTSGTLRAAHAAIIILKVWHQTDAVHIAASGLGCVFVHIEDG
eukprot:gene11866-14010_t